MRFKSGATLDFKDHLQVAVLTLNNQQLSFLLAFSSSLPYSLSLLPFSPHLPLLSPSLTLSLSCDSECHEASAPGSWAGRRALKSGLV